MLYMLTYLVLYFRGGQRGFEPAPAYYVYGYVYGMIWSFDTLKRAAKEKQWWR